MEEKSVVSQFMNARGQDFRLGCLYDYRRDKIFHHRIPLLFEVEQTPHNEELNEQRIIKFSPVGNLHLLNRKESGTNETDEPQQLAICNFSDKEALWDFFQKTSSLNVLDPISLSRSKWQVDHFPWQGKKVLDNEWACLDHHSKVSLITNIDAKEPHSANGLWSHEFDNTNEVARVLSIKYVTSKLTLDIMDETHLEEGYWNDDAGDATHLVTAVQYGIAVNCILQRYLRRGEAAQDAEVEMRALCDTLATNLKSGKSLEAAICGDITATVYGMGRNPVHGRCQEVFELLGVITSSNSFEQVKHLCRPLCIWLTPLKKHHGTCFTADLNQQELIHCQGYLDLINSLKAQANTLLQSNDGVKHFTYIRPLLHAYKTVLEKDKENFQSKLRELAVELRTTSGKNEASASIDQLIEEEKVFYEASKIWFEDIKNEISLLNTIEGHARQLRIPLVLDEDEIYRYFTDVQFEYICIFTLPPLSSQKCFLDEIRETSKSSPEYFVSKTFPIYRREEQELWYKTKRKEFYGKARQFFKDALNYQKYRNHTEDGIKIAFLMTPVPFEPEALKTPEILVYEDGILANENMWSEKLRTLLRKPLNNKNLEMTSQRANCLDPTTSINIAEEGRNSADLLESSYDTSNGLGADGRGILSGGAVPRFNSMGSFSEGNYDQPYAGYNYLQRSTVFASTDGVNELPSTSDHPRDTQQEWDKSLIQAIPSYNSSQSFDMSKLSRKESVDLESLQNHTQAGLNDSRLSTTSETASRDSLITIGSNFECSTEILKEIVREKSQQIANVSGIDIYALAMGTGTSEKKGKVRHFVFNQNSEFGESISMHRRTILLMGAAGSGKTSLVNSIINYVIGVKWEDTFRFEVQGKTTNAITIYDINHAQGLQIPYSLTIIDTPGYGAKPDADKNITESIRQYFKDEKSVQVVDAVCFVCSTSGSNSVKMQEYVTHTMLSIFGKDVKDNLNIFFTFTDSKPSSVPEIIRKTKSAFWSSKRKQPNHYSISNLACKEMNDNLYDLWYSSTENMKEFFSCMTLVQSKLLVLTRKVLDERRRLERILEALRPKISESLQKMDEIQKYRDVISEHETSPDNQKDYKIEVAVMKKVDISNTGNYLTNCQICQMTCHYPCAFREDQDKRRCYAIDGKTGYCRICPNKCSWSVHFSQTYRWVYSVETREGNIESLREKYNATSLSMLQFIEVLENEFKTITKDALSLMVKASECIQRLEQMALHFSPCTASSYISKMIDSERQQKHPGFEERIGNLRNLLDLAELSDRIHRNEPLLPQKITE